MGRGKGGGSATAEICALLRKHGMRFSGGFDADSEDQFGPLIEEHLKAGAETINVQLANHDTPVDRGIELTVALMKEADRQKANVHLEVHRDTCTETPEKAYAIADGFRQATGNILRMNVDHSHFAVVKHLRPEEFSERLLDRPE